MAVKDKKFLVLIVALTLLASCAKQPVVEENTTPTREDTPTNQQQADEELFNEINDALEGVSNSLEAEVNTEANTSTSEPSTDTMESSDSENTPQPTSQAENTRVVKLSQTYTSPGGLEEAAFEITLNDSNEIQDVKISPLNASEVGLKLMWTFGGAINTAVKGKTVSDALNISAVGGASLTTKAFVNALRTI